MHKKELWIFTNKCRKNVKHENEAEGHGLSALFWGLRLFPRSLVKIQNFYAYIEEAYSASLTIAREKQA